jgi:hypothetical protein
MGAKFAICASAATASSFTLPHGLLLWGLTFPVFLLAQRVAHWRRWLGAWVAAAAICASIYFHGYARPPYHPEFAPAAPFLDYLRFFLAFLGGEFAFATREHRLALATAAGAVLLVLFLTALGYAFVRRSDSQFLRRVLPWFVLGGYSIGSGCLATLGRIGFGINFALESRYVTFSLYLTVALIVLIAIIGKELRKSRPSLGFATAFAAFCLILGGAFLTLGAFASAKGVQMMAKTWAQTRLLRGGVLFSQVLDTSGAMRQTSHLPPEFVRANAADLDDLKLLRPALVRSVEISSLRTSEVTDARKAAGKCEAILAVDAERLRASGFATLPAKGRPADAVVLAYETSDRGWIAFAFSDEVARRPDVARALRNRNQIWSGWAATFLRKAVPAGARISAWGLDAEVPKLYRLEQSVAEPKL